MTDAAFESEAIRTPEGRERRLLVEHAARPVPVMRFLLIPVFGAVYAVLVALHPVLGASPESVFMMVVLAMLTFGYAMMSPNGDILDPMRVVSFYFLIVFCIAPLAMKEVTWHYTAPFSSILPGAVLYCAFAYLMILVGYHFPFFRPLPDSIEARSNGYNSSVAAVLGFLLFAVGLASWTVLFFLAGGIDGLIYSDKARGEFFEGFGYFFWGALFMFPGATLYWAAQSVGRDRVPWRHATLLVIAFATFLILQGRMRAMNFLILGIFVSHYLIRPLKPSRLFVFGIAGLGLALFIGFARSPSTRAESFLNPVAVVVAIANNFDTVGRAFITADLSRLRQVVLIMDKVPEWMPHDWGESFLLFLNPWLRLFGLTGLEIEGIGPRLFRLANPTAGPLPTGYLPSFLGEMLVNFPWPIACLFFVPYGMTLRWIYSRLIVRRGDFFAVAIYSILLLQAANIVLQSLSHVMFEMMVVLVPLFVVQGIARRRLRAGHLEQGTPV